MPREYVFFIMKISSQGADNVCFPLIVTVLKCMGKKFARKKSLRTGNYTFPHSIAINKEQGEKLQDS